MTTAVRFHYDILNSKMEVFLIKKRYRLISIMVLLTILLLFIFCRNDQKDMMGSISFSLPDNIRCEERSESSYSLYLQNNQMIGGLVYFDLQDSMDDWHLKLNEILPILYDAGIDEANPDYQYDIFMSSETYADWSISIWDGKKEYIHYLFLSDSFGYDFWFDRTQVDSNLVSSILKMAQITKNE